MNCSQWISLIFLTIQLNYAFGFKSKGIVEAVSVVPLESISTYSFGPVAKVSQLFHSRKSNVSRSSTPSMQALLSDVSKDDRILNTFTKASTPPLSSRFVQKRKSDLIYDRIQNPLISSDSWNDLNTLLPQEEMKEFLSSLPLHTLRNLTTMTRKNPELGQQQLVRMILDRSDRFKDRGSALKDASRGETTKIDTRKISGHKTNNLGEKNHNKKDKEPIPHTHITAEDNEIVKNTEVLEESNDHHHIRPSDTFITTSTAFPVLEPPTEFPQSTSTPHMESNRKNRVFPLQFLYNKTPVKINTKNDESAISESSNTNIVEEDHSPRQYNSFNSGYYIPLLTKDAPGISNDIDMSQPPQISWNSQPQDPENTYQPNVDNFLKAPSEHEKDFDENELESQSPIDTHPSSSLVWVPSESSLKDGPNDERNVHQSHPFSGFHEKSNSKLQAAASSDDISSNDIYKHQQDHPGYQDHEYQQPLHVGVAQPDHPSHTYRYTHSTVDQGPPNSQTLSKAVSHSNRNPPSHNNMDNNKNQYGDLDNNKHQYHYSNSDNNKNEYSSSDSNQNQNSNQNGNQNHKQQQQQSSPNSPQSPENSPGYNGNGWGWGDQGNSYWSQATSYFNKGNVAEKVFEISIAVLSFLAFGGYLLMLIYQVFAVSATVPLFPFLSSTIPANPTLLGVLLGRSMGGHDSQQITLGRRFDYINEVENVVKAAMVRVKAMWESTGVNTVKVKGDLGH